jgi:hypothetical protein
VAGGIGCKLEVGGVEDLLTNWTGNAYTSASGAPVTQLVEFIEGKNFEIKIDILPSAVYESLRGAANANLALQAGETGDATFTVIGTGDSGNFSVSAIWNPQKPFAAERFITKSST